MHRQTYEAFKDLLKQDGCSHDLMAELEVLYHEGKRLDMAGVRSLYTQFSSAVQAMIRSLAVLKPTDATTLAQYHKKLDFYVRFLLAPPEQPIGEPFVLTLSDITKSGLSGNKAFNLARLKTELQAPVPDGFVITTNAFHLLLVYNNLREPLDELLSKIDIEDITGLQECSRQLKSLILSAAIPPEVCGEVKNAFAVMEQRHGSSVLTAVRSSAVSEDGVHSFAGQYHTELGIDRESILQSYLKVLASKYSPEALFYRITIGLADEEAPMGVLVLPMINASMSGVVYTRIPEEPGSSVMAVHAIHGLGEVLVSGKAVGDIAYLNNNEEKIVRRRKGTQAQKLLMKGSTLKEYALKQAEREEFCLQEDHLFELGRWAGQIENLYEEPQDIEWAVTDDGDLFILQSRPLHQEKTPEARPDFSTNTEEEQILLTGGRKAAGGIAAGPVVIAGEDATLKIEPGAVLVTGSTPPSLVRHLNKITAVVAEQGSTAGHFSTVCREFGIPLLIGVPNALDVLQPGQLVTVDAENQRIYAGAEEELLINHGKGSPDDLPYFRKLRAIMDFITPLHLINTESKDFRPENCRSLHDIIRYTHEQAVQTMFSLGEKIGGRSKKRLQTEIPLAIHLLDVGGGFCSGDENKKLVAIEDICCQPFLALWKGLSHPGVDWQSHSHFDWKRSDEIALAGGFLIGTNSSEFASYAIMGRDYLNFNIRFGYHFTLVDTLCGKDSRTNFCQLRFAGGGGAYSGRFLRLEFLDIVLKRFGFEVTVKADLLDARLTEIGEEELFHVLDLLGRLLGATKLLDLVLRQEEDVEKYVEQFFMGKYTFTQPSA
jgi:pyruvate,water dikinase